MKLVLEAYHDNASIGAVLREQPTSFLHAYRLHNERLWHDLAFKRITAEELRWMRFAATLAELLPDATTQDTERLGQDMGEAYLRLYKRNWRLLEGANDLLNTLEHRFKLGVITNGFRDQQRGKLAQFGWEERFQTVVLSDEVGVMKPHAEIFRIAEERLRCSPDELVYVGDNYVSDVEGANNAGWRTIWLNPALPTKPDNCADATVQTLAEILPLFQHD